MATTPATPTPRVRLATPPTVEDEFEVTWDGRGSLPGYDGTGLGSSLGRPVR